MDLKKFFTPASVAIIGASKDISTINGKPLHYLIKHGYAGTIYPVNPKYEEVGGCLCYPSLEDIPGPVDLALIAVNYRLVPAMLEQCVKKGVGFATIFSSGFAEAGEEGRRMQGQLSEFASKTGLRICGPNCQGGVDLYNNTAAAFSASLDTTPFKPGPIGFVTQSGALGFSIFNLAQENGIGFSYVISTGNEVDLDCMDYIDFMIDDPNTKTIFLYLEGVRNGRKFVKMAHRALEKGKPLVVLKVGTSEIGSRAAASHTAALTGSDAVFNAFFQQKGIIRVDSIEGFIDLGKIISSASVMPKGNRLGVVSISGGGGVLCADTAEECGIRMAGLQMETVERIKKEIPPFGSPLNPVDITAQAINTAEGFSNVIQAMLADPGVDALVVVITMIVGEPGLRMARDLAGISAGSKKPIIVAWTAGEQLMGEQFEILRKSGVPYYQSPVRAVRALAKLMNYHDALPEKSAGGRLAESSIKNGEIPSLAMKILKKTETVLTEYQSKKLLGSFGIAAGLEEPAHTEKEALLAAEKIGFPVAMKIDSPDILHKTEAGGICLDVQDGNQLVKEYGNILQNASQYNPDARIKGVLIQEMIPPGVEVIIGVNRDVQFGAVIMFGIGGIFVELLKDVSLRIAPVNEKEAMAMIRETHGYKMLAGARGGAMGDISALAKTIERVSSMAMALGPRLKELDINPLIVLPEGKGVKVADALVVLQEAD